MTRPGKRSTAKVGIKPKSTGLEADALTTGPTRMNGKGRLLGNHMASYLAPHIVLDIVVVCWLLNVPAAC